MFQKLEWDYDLSPLRAAELTARNEYTQLQKYGEAMEGVTPSPLVTHVIAGAARDYALSLLPSRLLDAEVPEILRLDMDAIDAPNPSLTAHIDYKRRCAINVYLAANGETSHYYRWDRGAKSLEEIGQFVANSGEWWLLDTSIPHAVSLIPKKQRTVISYSFARTPFSKAKQLLAEDAP